MSGPLEVWQKLLPQDGAVPGVQADQQTYIAPLPDGRGVLLPIRPLPGGGALASLILNQASFAVLDAIADALAAQLAPMAPGLVVAVPTLGLPLAEAVARRLGHARMVPLGTSEKFWYDPALSVPLRSVTSPGGGKRLWLDPRMLPLLQGARVVLIDDVISTGSSMQAALALLKAAGCTPCALGAAMLQGAAGAGRLPEIPTCAPLRTPRLTRGAAGWVPEG
ncbi:phosphoribosyltransferase [Pseudoroseicyclus aestuarii]|uniref:Adenine/guanine phosphoribosyltransferase-like PRPP-binding protein n=1 Tax=Pseudoroseicyclus aestuarii TaxID=1795041 RepID=A0A318SY75_9RHOB|nr:phosphoribosyltransferase [Pseudoroseicyclus aestuarii]PYE85359.1 adenine/guanine phosphoribosyltransferase-like PRPP-binding protein [Pseudoroseicyclus aestuarii]